MSLRSPGPKAADSFPDRNSSSRFLPLEVCVEGRRARANILFSGCVQCRNEVAGPARDDLIWGTILTRQPRD